MMKQFRMKGKQPLPPQEAEDTEKGYKNFSDDGHIGKKWYEMLKDEGADAVQLSIDEVEKLKSEANRLLEQETALHNNKMSRGSAQSDYKWMHTIMNNGTATDRVAAHTIAIQDSPVHTLPLLRNLVGMVKVSKKKECILVLDTLTELFLSDLLRPNCKLREFERCPLSLLDKLSSGNQLSRKCRLIHWYYEDQLKHLYRSFVVALHAAAQDSVEHNKEKAITAMYKLLAGNPEQEALLLKNLVNKLGDPSQKVASKAIYSLVQLLQVHPNMKLVVMEETEKLLFRPNVGHKAQYYGICFLSQFLLSGDEAALARRLIHIYFSFFRACVKKGEVDSRLMSALLTGVNRAYPYAKQEMDQMLEHIDTLYRVVHHATFNVSLHTLSLLFQVADFANSVSDRFYSALYKKLLDAQLATSSHQALFLSLVFRALKKDDNVNRVRVFFKRLLQMCGYLPVPVVCGVLYMVSQLTHKKQDLLALKMAVQNLVDVDQDDDDEEHYEDIKAEDCEERSTAQDVEEKSSAVATWFHCKNTGSTHKATVGYNPLQRNPVYAGGEHCALTELLKLSQHFHPTVTLFANKILQGEVIKYPGDPLQDFALPRFLDRFVFKNPKQNIKEEVVKNCKFSRKKTYMPQGMRSLRVDSASYLNEDESRIPVEELFMYQYLKKKRSESDVKVKKEEDDEASSVASDEFHEMLDNLMAGKQEELDYADELGKAKKDKDLEEDGGGDASEESASEADSGHEGSLSEDDDLAMSDDDLDDDAEDIVFDDSGEDDEAATVTLKKEKKKKHGRDHDVFVSAEEFSEMLESVGTSGIKMSGSSTLSNKDNAGAKQLKWESDRNFRMNRRGKRPEKDSGGKRKWHNSSGSGRNERTGKRRRKK